MLSYIIDDIVIVIVILSSTDIINIVHYFPSLCWITHPGRFVQFIIIQAMPILYLAFIFFNPFFYYWYVEHLKWNQLHATQPFYRRHVDIGSYHGWEQTRNHIKIYMIFHLYFIRAQNKSRRGVIAMTWENVIPNMHWHMVNDEHNEWLHEINPIAWRNWISDIMPRHQIDHQCYNH